MREDGLIPRGKDFLDNHQAGYFYIQWVDKFQHARRMKHAWQLTTRGWSDRDCWNLDLTFAKFIAPPFYPSKYVLSPILILPNKIIYGL